MPARLHRLTSQLAGQRAVAGGVGGVDVLEVFLFDEKRRRIPTRVPVLLGTRAVQAVGTGLGREGDVQSDGMAHRGVETSGVDLILGDLVDDGCERYPAAAEIRRSVDAP